MTQPSEIEQPATTIKEWVAQIEASLVQITGVRVETTEAGLQVILETAKGETLAPETRKIGNALIADIPNAAIAQVFSQANPIEGIVLVSVTSLSNNQVQVTITGTDAPPVAEVTAEAQGLVLSVTVGDTGEVTEEDTIEIVVTGEPDEGYNPSSASTATRTDTPLRDIPASIQVVPQQVLEERNVRNLNEAVETVSGVIDNGSFYGAPTGSRIIRGFNQGFVGSGINFRNGAPDVDYYALTPIGTIEQVEVLRGPASVLFGAVEPGGIVNTITRQPLSEPYYNLAFEAGNYEFYQPSIDVSGPLTEDDTLLYRFIASYQSSGNIQPFVDEQQLTTIAPSITLNLGDRTKLNLYYEYINFFSDNIITGAVILSDGNLTPRDFYLGYPNLDLLHITTERFGYTFTHEISDNWRIRNNVAVVLSDFVDERGFPIGTVDDRFIQIEALDYDYTKDNYFANIDLLGEFNTGAITHRLLIGFDVNRFVENSTIFQVPNIPDLDLFEPDYDFSNSSLVPDSQFVNTTQSYGLYLQDQITLLDNLKLLIGGRYDWVTNENEIADFGEFGNTTDDPPQNDGTFSPRIGLVYQPSDTVSLYASYSRSFRPTTGFNPDGKAFEPTRGTQYEVGVKTDFLDNRLSAALAAYYLTRTNVTTEDPDDPRFSIQTGEQRSQGVELDIGGEILPGWNLTASYAYTDAEVTEDNVTPEGNRLPSVPEHQASLWTTYTIQEGTLGGLGFGLGLFYVSERQGDLENSYQIGDYLRTDAAVYYRRDRFNAAINIRNLFDTNYILTTFGARQADRGAPFTIVGTLSWTF
ncbi:TonB-dependent siderophore receptor (plasmid) [Gloeocapsa sp. PCC 7428]|uniref:TonB-dependent siderophore receptor n=1 Tax=Gloeocapsa sp. PCC 7428 TaxID=1173026 RepID=UPI0002A5CADD|nr:TonB-dependent siderophore receptor [Gloeocapsa sp. PCC 7428]AFZ33340.1 TonB-dependent siderophore receptor [Gloeocapsa sp. PCC 7428]